jgi:hypothetical protein
MFLNKYVRKIMNSGEWFDSYIEKGKRCTLAKKGAGITGYL